jgi:hypothetical protein
LDVGEGSSRAGPLRLSLAAEPAPLATGWEKSSRGRASAGTRSISSSAAPVQLPSLLARGWEPRIRLPIGTPHQKPGCSALTSLAACQGTELAAERELACCPVSWRWLAWETEVAPDSMKKQSCCHASEPGPGGGGQVRETRLSDNLVASKSARDTAKLDRPLRSPIP